MLQRAISVLDAVVFSSLWAAAVAAALSAASGETLGLASPLVLRCAALAFAGTLCVYNVDRLRDLERDALSAPERTRFIRGHERPLRGVAGAAGFAAAALAATLPGAVAALCALVLALGLLHRRLKGSPGFKAVYVTGAWLAITVGVPLLATGRALASPHLALWTAGLVGSALAANLLGSNARPLARITRRPAAYFVSSGLVLSGAGSFAACLAPAAARSLGWIPAVEAIALAGLLARARQRLGDRYGLVVVDGALLLGALAALVRSAGGAA